MLHRYTSRNNKPLLLSLLFIAATLTTFSQNYRWSNALTNTDPLGGGAYGQDVRTDASGNTYVVGYFQQTADFDPGPGVANLSSAQTDYDMFIAKYDASGNYVWAKSIGGAGTDMAMAVTSDAAGNIYVTGYYSGTADFDPGPGTATLTGYQDIFFAKYTSAGNLVFVKGINGSGSENGSDIELDASGNIYLVGNLPVSCDFDPGVGTQTLTSAGSNDIFIAKYDASGNYIFAKALGGTGSDNANKMVLDASANIYISGVFNGTADFDGGAGATNLVSAGNADIYFAKYNSNGDLVLAKSVGGTGTEMGGSIGVDNSGNIYLSGSFSGTADFDPGAGTQSRSTYSGTGDFFLAKYNSTGAYVFANVMGGANHDYAYAMSTDASGNCYIIGPYGNSMDLDPGAGTQTITAVAFTDFFLVKYNASGAFVYGNGIGGTGSEYAYGISIDASGNAYLTGNFNNTMDADPGAGVQNLTSTPTNAFVAKYNTTGAYVYAGQMGRYSSTTLSDQGKATAVDAMGNTYVIGTFQGGIDFDPGAGTAVLTSAGSNDVFFAKYDRTGNYVYARAIGGTSAEAGNAIKVDGSGNVYITGSYNGTVDFDPGAGTQNLVSAGSSDIYFAKYDASGNYVYAKSIGGSSSDVGNALEIDASGNVYITGYFNSTADFDPNAATQNLISAGSGDVFIAKYDASGNYVFAKSMGGTGNDMATGIDVSATNNVYITGSFSGTADFDPSAGTVNLVSVGGNDVFIGAYDASGNLVFAKNMGSATNDAGNAIAVSGTGTIYITGNYTGTADFDPGAGTVNITSLASNDIFVASFNTDGTLKYAVSIGSTSSDVGYGIAADASDNVYVTGVYAGTMDADPGPGTDNLVSAGSNDIFIAKYDVSGNYVYAKSFGGTASDNSAGIAIDASGNTFITGFYSNSADFDPGTGVVTGTGLNGNDLFIGAYGVPVALPVTWLSFTAKAYDNSYVQLNWSTAAEQNNSYFEVLRSVDGVQFETIGKINASDQGYTTQHYMFRDLQPNNGVSYYRIKQVDLDGRSSLTGIAIINLKQSDKVSVTLAPQPMQTTMTARISSNIPGHFIIYSFNGAPLKTYTISAGNTVLYIERGDLAAGMYLYRLTGAGKTIETGKIIVQ